MLSWKNNYLSRKRSGSLVILYKIGNLHFDNVIFDLRESVNFMFLSIFRQLRLGEPKATFVILQMMDGTIKNPLGMVEDVLLKVEKFIFPTYFIILDLKTNNKIPIGFWETSLATGRTLVNVERGELIMRLKKRKSL